MNLLKIILLVLVFGFLKKPVFSQSPVFYHLSTAEGLSDNNANAACMDKNGILWIATTEALNSFDGNRISTYHTYNYPAMAANNIDDIVADSYNNLWLKTNTASISMLDEKRNFRLFTIGDSTNKKPVTELFTTSIGTIAIKNKQQFICSNTASGKFEKLNFPLQEILPSTISFVSNLSEDKVIFYGQNRLLVIDYSTMTLLLDMPIKKLTGAAAINPDELLVYTVEGDVFYRISLSQKKIVKEYRNLLDQYNKPIEGNLRNIVSLNAGRFVITSRFSGLYFLNLEKEALEHYTHDPLDLRSIGGNNTYRIKYDSSGHLLITTQSSGVHYYNVKHQQAASKSYFIDAKADIFDGFLQSLAATKDSMLWIGAQDRLIRWNRKNDKVDYIACYLPNGRNISKEETIRNLHFDDNGNLWVGTTRYGILILNPQLKTIAQITRDESDKKPSLNSGWINSICVDKDGNRWVATVRGVSIVDKNNYSVKSLKDHPVLSTVNNINCINLWVDSKDRIWMGSRSGVYCYDEKNNSLQHYTTADGLANNVVHATNEDNYGNIYFGTSGGFSVLSKDGTIKSYNRSNGLKNDKCEGILKDEKGFLWIGNLNCILRYDPVNKTFAVFEEGYGFSHAGFRMRCCFKSDKGEMFWGSDKGLTWFYPGQLNSISTGLHPSVNTLQTSNGIYRFTRSDTVNFSYNIASFVFQIASGDITGGKKITYQYRLLGLNKDWKNPVSNAQVTFTELPPGKYVFEVKASRDGINWFEGAYPVVIRISKPWWQQNWLRILYLLAATVLLYVLYKNFRKRKNEKEVKKLLEYFENSGYEHSSVEDIVWDISRNCISRLGFDDCVIYLLDDERKLLVQKAAYGPKSQMPFEINNPIEIPVGKGIVGDVALTAKACIVKDTSKDSRYIVDDENRLSEICVPIIHNGKVIGIIDSENKKKNFFTPEHLKSLQDLASICASKIFRAIAMDAIKKSRLEVMELNVKIAESKFLNLRLQMNPHFLFNSLSSIQLLIVSKQTNEAYKYLTLFSNFLRSLLNYAEKNFMSLDEELKVLKMYIELESLRFDKTFSYEINVDETLANDEILVPSLMVQPFVENAIWHGLLHKEGDKKLSIQFINHEDEYLTCSIEDNGIGRLRSDAIQKNKITSIEHQSKGIAIIKERLSLLQQKTGKPAHVEIKDLYNQDAVATGTKVIIIIPFYNPEES